jgi:hypothetical protein
VQRKGIDMKNHSISIANEGSLYIAVSVFSFQCLAKFCSDVRLGVEEGEVISVANGAKRIEVCEDV